MRGPRLAPCIADVIPWARFVIVPGPHLMVLGESAVFAATLLEHVRPA